MFDAYFISACVLLLISLAANLFQVVWAARKKDPKTPSYEASQLLADLLRGGTLVRIERVAPEDVFLRSPRRAGR